MTKILVTGANGQLGRSLNKIRGDYPELSLEFKSSRDLDITRIEGLNKSFKQNNYQYCINCAAYTNVEQAEKTPAEAFRINAQGTKNLAVACRAYGTTLVHISTDYVFDGEKEGEYTPDDAPNPINEYGRSKLEGEKYIQEILEQYFIIRTSWLYSEFGKNFYRTILEKAKRNEVLYVTNQQKGSPTNATNLASYILNLLKFHPADYGIMHYTDGKAMTWYEFALEILKENGLETTAKIVKDRNYRSFAPRPKNSVLKSP